MPMAGSALGPSAWWSSVSGQCGVDTAGAGPKDRDPVGELGSWAQVALSSAHLSKVLTSLGHSSLLF